MSLNKKLGLGNPKPNTIILQLVDRSCYVKGCRRGCLSVSGIIYILVDFVVLNFELDSEVTSFSGRYFLAIGWAMINVLAGKLTMRAHEKLTMRAHDNVEVFDVYKALDLPNVYEELSTTTIMGIEKEAPYIASKDPLERVLVEDYIYRMLRHMKWYIS